MDFESELLELKWNGHLRVFYLYNDYTKDVYIENYVTHFKDVQQRWCVRL